MPARAVSDDLGAPLRLSFAILESTYVLRERYAPSALRPTISADATIVDPKYLQQIRVEAKGFSTKSLCRQSALAGCAIRSFKNGKNTIRPRSLRKRIRAIHDLQNKENAELKD